LKPFRLAGRVCALSAASCFLSILPARGSVLPGPRLSSAVREADDYYLGRFKLENARRGLAILRQAVLETPQDYEAWWRISRTASYIARHTQGRERLSLLNEAIQAGKKAVALRAEGVEGHFWLGANYGLLAQESGFLTGLRLVDAIRKEIEIVIRLDPDYEEDAGHRLLARLYYRAPFFKGGDKRRSVELLQQSLKRFPDNSLTMLYLADSLLAVGRREEARQELEKILKLCPNPLYGPEQTDNQVEARERLAEHFGARE
jgi:tetratricopeptide (TPR) repeat protein